MIIRKYGVIIIVVAMMVLFAIIALEISPLLQVIPGRDSGVFLYVGQRILNGQVPYRDVWDHKGPLLYFLNALGLWLAGGSVWGVWIIQLFFLGAAFLFSYISLKQALGYFPTLLAVVFWPVCLMLILEGGNFTEQYSLTLNFIVIFLYIHFLPPKKSWFLPLFAGSLLALNSILRQNNAGAEITLFLIFLFFFTKTYKERFTFLLCGITGFLIVLIPVLMYLIGTHSLGPFIDEFIRYNLIYVQTDFINRIGSIWFGIYSFKGLFLIPLIGWLLSINVFSRRITLPPPVRAVALFSLIDFPLEIVFSALSGRGYARNYINWLPVLSMQSAFLIWFFQTQVLPLMKARSSAWILTGIYSLIVVSLVGVPLYRSISLFPYLDAVSQQEEGSLKSEVRKYLHQENYLLMWGGEASVNFITGYPSPSRFVYQSPLYMPGYQSPAMIEELLVDIDAKHPIIIDTSPTNWLIPPIDSKERSVWDCKVRYCQVLPEMSAVFTYIQLHYQRVGTIQEKSWPVYQYSG